MCIQRTYLDEDTGDWWSDHELAVRAVSFLVSQRESRILLLVGTATARKLAGTRAEKARQGVDRLLTRGTATRHTRPLRGPNIELARLYLVTRSLPVPLIPDTISGSCGRACRLSSSARTLTAKS
jgi:hypothetical protein